MELVFFTACWPSTNILEDAMVTEERETGVEGTAVYGEDTTKIGSIDRIMIDKRSGGFLRGTQLWRISRNGQ